MDWTLALQLNQQALQRSIAWLFTWLGLEVGGSMERMPRHKWRTVLFVLRPSESALRRLVLVAVFVWGTKAPPLLQRAAQSARSKKMSPREARAPSAPPPFKLIDPRKQFDLNPNKPKRVTGPGPRITDMWSDDPIYDRSDLYAYQDRQNRPVSEDMSAKALCHRLNALKAALDDLPKQALRMVTLQARLERRFQRTGQPNLAPMRPGLPPGYRRRPLHEVDAVLAECHTLAKRVLYEAPDTS